MAIIVRETNSFINIMQLINPNYHSKNEFKQIKNSQEKLQKGVSFAKLLMMVTLSMESKKFTTIFHIVEWFILSNFS